MVGQFFAYITWAKYSTKELCTYCVHLNNFLIKRREKFEKSSWKFLLIPTCYLLLKKALLSNISSRDAGIPVLQKWLVQVLKIFNLYFLHLPVSFPISMVFLYKSLQCILISNFIYMVVELDKDFFHHKKIKKKSDSMCQR